MKTIVWDVDDTLNFLVREWLSFYKDSHPECKLNYDQLTNEKLIEVLKIDERELCDSFDNFKIKGYFDILQPNIEILNWFKKYGDNFYHIALTASSLKTVYVSARWVFKHFSEWIRNFHVVPSYRYTHVYTVYDASKAEYIKRIGGVDIVIDDCIKNYNEINKTKGVKCYLIKKPWNKGEEIKSILNKLTEQIKI